MKPISKPLPRNPRKAIAELSAVDPALARAIQAVGPFRLPKRPATLHQLCREVIGQQLSVIVAAKIGERFTALVGEDGQCTPGRLLKVTPEDLRACGLSRAKITTVHGLAEFWHRERLTGEKLGAMPDEELIDHLTQVKGIGPWTVKMFLIFSLNRPNVLPQEDLGLRAALRRIDNLGEMPAQKEVLERCQIWAPWSTVATWYAWASLKL